MKNLLLLFGLILWNGCNNAPQKSENSNPPNIIYIMADDLGYGDIGTAWPRGLPKEACAFCNYFGSNCYPSSALTIGQACYFYYGNLPEERGVVHWPLRTFIAGQTGAFAMGTVVEGDPTFKGLINSTVITVNGGAQLLPYPSLGQSEQEKLTGNTIRPKPMHRN